MARPRAVVVVAGTDFSVLPQVFPLLFEGLVKTEVVGQAGVLQGWQSGRKSLSISVKPFSLIRTSDL